MTSSRSLSLSIAPSLMGVDHLPLLINKSERIPTSFPFAYPSPLFPTILYVFHWNPLPQPCILLWNPSSWYCLLCPDFSNPPMPSAFRMRCFSCFFTVDWRATYSAPPFLLPFWIHLLFFRIPPELNGGEIPGDGRLLRDVIPLRRASIS